MSQLLSRHTGLDFLVPLITFLNIVPTIPCLYHAHGHTWEAATERHGKNIFCAYELGGKSICPGTFFSKVGLLLLLSFAN